MAIDFNPATKIITLDSFSVSASEIWSRWIDWVVLSDNSKYPIAFSQLGGVAPVALYLFLENGWRVKPQELDGQTTVTGNLLVQGGGNPFVATVGNFASQMVIEAPLAAQAITVNSGSGVTAQDKVDIAQAVDDILQDDFAGVSSFDASTDEVNANIAKINQATVNGSGISTDLWRGD